MTHWWYQFDTVVASRALLDDKDCWHSCYHPSWPQALSSRTPPRQDFAAHSNGIFARLNGRFETEKLLVVWGQKWCFICVIANPEVALSHFEHLYLGHIISSREKFSGPACPMNVLIPWFPCSCRDLHPPMRPVTHSDTQWHTVTHWLRSVSVAEAVSCFKEKVGTHFSKKSKIDAARAKWRSLDVGRSSFGGFGHRPMPLCNHTWPSILKRRSLTRTLGPTWDPLSSSTGCQCIWCRTSTCRTWKQRCRFHIFHQLPGALGMWRFMIETYWDI